VLVSAASVIKAGPATNPTLATTGICVAPLLARYAYTLSEADRNTRPRPSRNSCGRYCAATRPVTPNRITITIRIRSLIGYAIATAKAN
jgi:hypothetical protein